MHRTMSVLLMILYLLVQSNIYVTGDLNKEIKILEERIQNNNMEDTIQNNDTEDKIQNNEENFHYYFNEESIDNEESSDYFSQFDQIVLENSNNSHYTFSHSSTTNNDTRQGLITVSSSSILPFIQAALGPLGTSSLLRALVGILPLLMISLLAMIMPVVIPVLLIVAVDSLGFMATAVMSLPLIIFGILAFVVTDVGFEFLDYAFDTVGYTFDNLDKLFEDFPDLEEIEKIDNIINMDVENVTKIEDNLSFEMKNNSVPRYFY